MKSRSPFVTFLPWLLRLKTRFARRSFGRTALLVTLLGLGRIANLLALVLPVKIVLLAGGEGVPHYFAGFVTPETKNIWIVGAAIVALASYVLGVFIDSLGRQIAASTAPRVLVSERKLRFVNNQESEGARLFERISRCAADLIFFLVGFAVGFIVDAATFSLVTALIAVQYLAISIMVQRPPGRQGRLARYVTHHYETTLKLLASADFLVGFLVILGGLLLQPDRNVLLAMLSMLILRQTLNALSAACQNGVELWQARQRIEALTYRNAKVPVKEKADDIRIRDLFERAVAGGARNRMAFRLPDVDDVRVRWADERIPGISVFKIDLMSEGERRHFQQHLFTSRRHSDFENENILFEHVPRAALHAPQLVERFSEGDISCQIVSAGDGLVISAREWRVQSRKLLFSNWQVEPPKPLVELYRATHHLLADRVVGHAARLKTVAQQAGMGADLGAFEDAAPALKSALSKVPLFVHNQHFHRLNVAASAAGEPLIMSWARWSLEPVGIGLDPLEMNAELLEAIEELKTRRKDVDPAFSIEHVHLVRLAWRLDRDMVLNRPRSALNHLKPLVARVERLAATT